MQTWYLKIPEHSELAIHRRQVAGQNGDCIQNQFVSLRVILSECEDIESLEGPRFTASTRARRVYLHVTVRRFESAIKKIPGVSNFSLRSDKLQPSW